MTSGRMADAIKVEVRSSAFSAGGWDDSATLKSPATSSGSALSTSTSHQRLLPASWRSVREKIAAMRQASTSALGEVLEHALEGVVEGLDALYANAQPLRDDGHGALEKRNVIRADAQAVLCVDLHRFDRTCIEEAGRESTRVRRVETDDERPVVELLADRAEVAARSELAADHEMDAVGELLHLLEDVRRDEDGPSFCGELPDHFAEVEPLDGVGARERLVEQKQIRVVDECCGEARPLTHPTGVPAQPTRLRVRQPDHSHRRLRSRGRLDHMLESCAELNELEPREEVVDRLVLGHVADPPIERGIAADLLAEDAHGPLRWRRQVSNHAQEGRLARAVRAEQRDHAWVDSQRDVGDGDHTAEPLRDVVDCDRRRRGGHGHWRTSADVRRTRSAPRTTVSPTSQSAETPADTGLPVFRS